ncbi:MAG: sugar transferase [Marmoricola sp.]|nr:sugar transferase [Marmoricola sp.]
MASSVVQATRVSAAPRSALRYIPTVASGIDLVILAASVFGAIALQLSTADSSADAHVGDSLNVVGPVMILGWVAAIFLMGGYRAQVFGAGLDEYKATINASLVTAAAVGIGCYLLRVDLSRGFFVLAFAIGMPLLVAGRVSLRRGVQRARTLGSLQHRVVIAGAEGHVDEIAAVLNREKKLGYNVIGALTPEPGERLTTHSGIPLLGASRSLAQVAIDAEADVVFLAGGAFTSSVEMRQLAWDLEHEDIAVVIAPSVTDVSSERVSVRPVGGMPLIHLERSRTAEAVPRAKRAFDIIGSLCLLVAFSPVLVFAAFKVWRFDGGPVLFRQARVGRDGAGFRCWKFRTTDVETMDELPAEGVFREDDDRHVTGPGKWLRRFSIDQLPQLVNVLLGDMSLVGPRPPLRHEVAQYDDDMARRLRVRPGMTGLWLISGRNDLSWSETIRLDLYYVDNWSVLQDLTILARTWGAARRLRRPY